MGNRVGPLEAQLAQKDRELEAFAGKLAEAEREGGREGEQKLAELVDEIVAKEGQIRKLERELEQTRAHAGLEGGIGKRTMFFNIYIIFPCP